MLLSCYLLSLLLLLLSSIFFIVVASLITILFLVLFIPFPELLFCSEVVAAIAWQHFLRLICRKAITYNIYNSICSSILGSEKYIYTYMYYLIYQYILFSLLTKKTSYP